VIFKDKYLGFIAAARHMVGSGTMAAFATLMRGLLVLRSLPVWRFLPAFVDFFVARLAGVGADVFGSSGGRIRRWKACGLWIRRLCAGGSLLEGLAEGRPADSNNQKTHGQEQKNTGDLGICSQQARPPRHRKADGQFCFHRST